MPSRFLNNITVNDSYTLPSADGTADQIITTDGAGQLSFVDQSTISAGNAEHVVIYAKNTSGSQIDKGTPVYITGTVGATDTVAIAPADAGNASHMPAVGLLDDTLLNNEFGYVITGGFMDNITTDPIDGDQPASNDTVYVKVGGGLTLTKPTGPTGLIQNIAKVGKVSGGNSGSLIVSSILRTNDVPNLTTGKIWVGNSNTVESTVVHLDETNGRMGVGTNSPNFKLDVDGDISVWGRIELNDGGSSAYVGTQSGFVDDKSDNRNAGFGYQALRNNTSGYHNTGVGNRALYENISGKANTAIGYRTLYANKSNDNTAIGFGSMYFNTIGVSNTAQGFLSLYSNIDGNNNVAIGDSTMYYVTSGSSNVALGHEAGRRIANGSNTTDTNNSIFIGENTSPLSNGETNQIVIGYEADGLGSNTVVVGNDSILKTVLKGNIGIGTTSPNTLLDVSSANTGATAPTVRITNTLETGSWGGVTDDLGRFEFFTDDVSGNAPYTLGYVGIKNDKTGSLPTGAMVFATTTYNAVGGAVERMRINSDGEVGIGTTTPSYKLDVNGDGRVDGTFRCVTLVQTSQRDQKENINNIDKSKAKAIPFKEYTYKSSIDGSARKRYGVIAEDIENDYPELVHTGADGVKGINYIDLLVKRVAELEKELEDISLTPGATGPQGPSGSNGNDGNSHLSNVDSITFDEKANQLVLTINRTDFRFSPVK